jgi:hypothetical protein
MKWRRNLARDVVKVIDQMLKVLQGIPDPLPKHKHLEAALKHVCFGAGVVAPEAVGQVWDQLGAVLFDSIGEPHAAYERKLQSIFNGEPDMDEAMKRIEALEEQVGLLQDLANGLLKRLGPYQ